MNFYTKHKQYILIVAWIVALVTAYAQEGLHAPGLMALGWIFGSVYSNARRKADVKNMAS